MQKGEQTRERILAIAQDAVLAKGFSSTSLEEIRTEAGLTKSGFLYHFPDKTSLAKALLIRYINADNALFDDVFARAAELHDDPLHRFLIGLKLLAEVMGDLPSRHPGCVVAAVAYHDRQFNAEIRALNAEALRNWRDRFHAMLREAAERHEQVLAVDLEQVADMLTGVIEGGLVLTRVYDDPTSLPRQINLYRQFVASIFGQPA